MLPSAQTYGNWLAVIRIYTGIFWLTHGIPKLLTPQFFGDRGMMVGMVTQMSSGVSGPYGAFLHGIVLPHGAVFSVLVACGETLAGVSLLLGALTTVGGVVGMFLALNYFMMKGSYAHITSLGGLDCAAIALSFISAILPTGAVFGLDGLLRVSRRRPSAAGEA